MRVSDYIIQYLRDEYNVDTIFTVSGGGCIFLIDSLGHTEGVKYVATHHEQAAAFAAEGYARIHNKLGACIVTSGPGGTNAITGTLCSWLDSIPIIIISGQVNKELTVNYTKQPLRQLGDQEFNIIESVKYMTKYAVQINELRDIKFHLQKACYLATTGRPGPVWLDIPLDIQSADIDPIKLDEYIIPTNTLNLNSHTIDTIVNEWNNAKKPLLIVGNGIRLSKGIDSLKKLLTKTNIPVITSVNGNDIINSDYEYYCGRFGTHAQIGANNLLSKCDFLLTIGSRLYVRQIGYNFKDFAKQAYRVYVDIDKNELNKSTLFPNIAVESDAKFFIDKLLTHNILTSSNDWLNECKLSNNLPKVLQRHRNLNNLVSIYAFMEQLSENLPLDHHIITSNGSANVVSMQVLDLKGNQRLITNTGCAPMGYGLSAAIGASIHNKIICLEGDGSLHLNIHELQTIKHYNLPIKLILINNDGYLSIKLTQQIFFNSRYVASGKEYGVSFPNFKKIFEAYEIPYFNINNNLDIQSTLKTFLLQTGPCVLEVFTNPNEVHEPKVQVKLDSNGIIIPGQLEDIDWINR